MYIPLTKIKKKLSKQRDLILSNIEKGGMKTKEIMSVSSILLKLNSEFGSESIERLNVESLLRKVRQIIKLKKKNSVKSIKQVFNSYYESIDERINNIAEAVDSDLIDEMSGEKSIISRKFYYSEKYKLQIELLKLQEWVVKNKKKVAIVFEGRDAAGKGSSIKRFTEYLNVKHFRTVALGIPTEEEKVNWFERYEKELPKEGEMVFFDRSWYNRAVVEPAMGYCSFSQYESFIDNVLDWEEDLIENKGYTIIKFWFSVSKYKQAERFESRQKSPLKYWKYSKNDEKSVDKWSVMDSYKNKMFAKSSSELSPWVSLNSNDKKVARLNSIKYVLSTIDYDDKIVELSECYPEVVNVIS